MRASPVLFAIVAAAVGAVYGCSLPLEGLSASANSGGAGGERSVTTTTTGTASASGGGMSSSASTGGTACTTKDQCPPDNPCSTYECTMSHCVASTQDDGSEVLPAAGDCKKTLCMGGAPVVIPDLEDAVKDNDPCTSDTCDDNGPVHKPGNNGNACGSPGHYCFDGQCRDCGVDDNCNDDGNPCTSAVCNKGTCQQKNVNGACFNGGLSVCAHGSCCLSSQVCYLQCCSTSEHCTLFGCKSN